MEQAPTPSHRLRVGTALILAIAALLAVGILWGLVAFAVGPGPDLIGSLFHDPNGCGGG